jgi:hypothetical protein
MTRSKSLGTVAGVFAVCAAAAGCNQAVGPVLGGPQIQGSGVLQSEERAVAEFSEINLSSAVELELAVGPPTSLTVTADDNILPHVVTDVSGGRLSIFINASTSSQKGVQIKATTPRLSDLVGNGAVRVAAEGISGDQFHLALNGASTCRLAAEVDELEADVQGASTALLAGSAEALTLECQGASRIDADDLKARRVVAAASGASRIQVTASDQIAARADGASLVRYRGRPSKVTRDATGASTIEAAE